MMWHTSSIPVGRRRAMSESVMPGGANNTAVVDLSPGASPTYSFLQEQMAKQKSKKTRSSSLRKRSDSYKVPVIGTPPSVATNPRISVGTPPSAARVMELSGQAGRLRSESQPIMARGRSSLVKSPNFPPSLDERAMMDEIEIPDETDGIKVDLRHKDFVPNPIKGKKDDYEQIHDLMKRVNVWLAQNGDVQLMSCETITWVTTEKVPLHTDRTLYHINQRAGTKNKVIRGVRLWYQSLGGQFWHGAPRRILWFRDYTPGVTETTTTLLERMNEDVMDNPVHGHIVKVETLSIPERLASEQCVWVEQPDKDSKNCEIFRLFYMEFDGALPHQGEIGIRDFLPRRDDASPHSQGFENYCETHKRAARWLYRKNNAYLINLQTLFVKVKKEQITEPSDSSKVWEPVSYTVHGDRPTDYFQILRAIYYTDGERKKHSKITQDDEPYKVTYKTFIPKPLSELCEVPEDQVDESLYEDVSITNEKISSWITAAGADVLSIETVSVRCKSGRQDIVGPEASFVYNHRSSSLADEPWINCIRIHLNGDYKNFPHQGFWIPWKQVRQNQHQNGLSTKSINVEL